MITPTHYMLLSAALFMIGVIGVMVRRNIIIIFMSIELILNAVNINLVAFSSQLHHEVGQVFAIFVIAVAAAEAAVGPGVILAFWQLRELPADAREYVREMAPWIPAIPLQTHDGIVSFHVPWGFRLDPLAGMMILVVTGIGTLIHVYSTAYIADEPRGGVARF